MKPVAVVTGASQGLGLELASALAAEGWTLVVDARRDDRLRAAAERLSKQGDVVAIAGDIADAAHRRVLIDAAAARGPIGLLVNNASTLGASPMPWLADLDSDVLRSTLEVNVVAPLELIRASLVHLADGAVIVNVTSDAAVEGYPGWGAYASSKAALEQISRVLAAERPDLRVLIVDPGDMRTEMHQDAFPGEDISDRPLPETSVRGLLALIHGTQPSGRYLAREVA